MNKLLAQLAANAARNDGVVSRADARSLGAAPYQITRWVSSGRLIAQGPRALVFVGAADSFRARVRVALVNAGDRAVASHRTAARLLGLEGFDGDVVEVTVPRQRRSADLEAVVVHSTTKLERIDTTEVAGIPCTSGARTVIDLAPMCSKRELERAIDSGVRAGYFSIDYLRRRLGVTGRSGRPGIALLDSVLVDSGGTNRLERQFLKLCRAARLPRPLCQVVMKRGDQSVARVDFHFHSVRVVVEVEGQIGHASPTQRNRDARRRRDLAAQGESVVTFTFDDVFETPERAIADVRAAIVRANSQNVEVVR